MNLPRLTARLQREEGWRSTVYDDATGLPIVTGTIVKGTPTIGWGTNLVVGISQSEGLTLLQNRLGTCIASLSSQLPWVLALDEVRQEVFAELVFNLGIHGLKGFVEFLDAAQRQDWLAAHNALLDSVAAHGLPVRYGELAGMLLEGTVAV